jgi:hypothetical protein
MSLFFSQEVLMAISRPCPKCQQPLSIPEPVPEKIQCPKCATVIKFKMPAATSPPAAAPSPPAPLPEGEGRKAPPNVAVGKPATPAKAPVVAKPQEPEEEPLVLLEEVAPAKKSTPQPDQSGGILSYLHTVIPKPIVFGFYGALGGLLGVLLLGELFWLILHPTPQILEPLRIAVAEELTVYPGSRNTLQVKIKRQGFEGPVRLEATGPGELVIPEVTIPADKEEADLLIEAIPQAERAAYDVKLRATSPNDKKVGVTEAIKVWIQPSPPSVGLTVSRKASVYAAGQNTFGFKLARQRFEGPVRVEVLDLPKGVNIPIVMVSAKEEQGIIRVIADKDAKLGAEILPVEVRSLADHKIAARAEFQLDVLPPPGKLQLAAAPQVTVYPGTKNKMIVKIARQEFEGEIQIEVTGAPRGITFSSATIPADKSETEIAVAASTDMLPTRKDLMVNAKAVNPINLLTKAAMKENVSTSIPLELNIVATPPTVQLAVSPKVPVYPGGTAKFGVKISRARFKGDVALSVQGANPAFVTIPPIKIAADQSEGEMVVSVTPAALALQLKQIMPVQVMARSASGAVTMEKVDIEILPPPSDLQLTVSPEVEIYQAGRCSFTVKVARTGFLGPVQVNFNNVPAGVTLAPGVIVGNDLVLKGHAMVDVAPKKYEIELVGTGPKAPDGKVPTKTAKFNLTVKPFDPSYNPFLDIVFVLDVTQSLDPQIAGLRDGIGQFVKGLKDKQLEARIGLVGFRDIIYDEVPFERLKFKGELFTTDIQAFATEVGKLKAMGGGDDPESSLDGIVEATKYPFRPKALKVLLLITDEKPQTKGNSVTMAIAQKALRDKKIDQVHLIIKKADEPNYKGLQLDAKGGIFDFHVASKQAEGFKSILPLLSKEIATTIGAPEPVAKEPGVPESALPPMAPAGEKTPEPRAEASPSSPTPTVPAPPVAGQASSILAADPGPPRADDVSPPRAEPAGVQGVQSTAVYDEGDRTQLLIAIGLWTAALAAGIALMLVGAQKRYLRQAWLSLGEVAKALLAGLAAGLFAGIVVQWFFNLSTSGSAWWIAVSRVVAWIVLGGLIGAAMSFFVPNMQRKRAVIGGCIGGFIGALGFALVNLLADSFLGQFLGAGLVGFLGRLIGAGLLGLFIGVMVALAEIASRRYWLEVAFGEREIRTVTLGTATVAVGGDEKLVGVFVPNAPAKAFGFRVDKNRVFCEDFATGKTIEAPPGEQWTVASAKIRVCSPAHAQPTGANLKLVVARDVPLMVGMPLTGDDIPGLEAQGSDGIVALVSRRPNNPKIYLLRNRSKQAWIVTEADGKQRKVEPGLSIELSAKCEIDFGQVKGMLDPSQEN